MELDNINTARLNSGNLPKSFKAKKHLSFTALRKSLSACINQFPDSRQANKIKYDLHDVMMSAFACMYFQSPSFLAYQRVLNTGKHRNNLQTLFGVSAIPQDSQLRDVIDQVSSEHFRVFYKELFTRLQRSKYLSQYQFINDSYLCSLDATQYHSSNSVHCEQCLTQQHKNGDVTYSHKVLQAAIMHPACRQVLPVMPEEIKNVDGTSKQDCEINAAKRFLPKLRKTHPQLNLIILGDGLYSHAPMINALKTQRMNFILVAKPDDHKYMMEWLGAYPTLDQHEYTDEKGQRHCYRWMNSIPLNGDPDAPEVNYFDYELHVTKKDGQQKITYRNSWVTDLSIQKTNIIELVKAGRCRWKIENECFNTLKNQGYEIEHNYGHGQKNLCHNFYLLTLLAFTFHQILELTDKLFQACRKECGSKRSLWEKLRVHVQIFVFDAWETLLELIYDPDSFETLAIRKPP